MCVTVLWHVTLCIGPVLRVVALKQHMVHGPSAEDSDTACSAWVASVLCTAGPAFLISVTWGGVGGMHPAALLLLLRVVSLCVRACKGSRRTVTHCLTQEMIYSVAAGQTTNAPIRAQTVLSLHEHTGQLLLGAWSSSQSVGQVQSHLRLHSTHVMFRAGTQQES